MYRKKTLLLFVLPALLVVSLGVNASALIGSLDTRGVEATSTSVEADALWEQLASMPNAWRAPHIEDDIERTTRDELRDRKYRELGLKFYDTYPGDPRRWEWLLNTFNFYPDYWQDVDKAARLVDEGKAAPIDQEAARRWEMRFRNELQPAFFASPQVTAAQRTAWYGLEMGLMEQKIEDCQRHTDETERRRACRPLLPGYLKALQDYAAHPAAKDSTNEVIEFKVSGLLSRFQWFARGAGLTFAEQKTALASLEQTSHPFMQDFARGIGRRLALRETPLELQGKTFDGATLDVATLRGKIVLVDLWSLGCSNCIEAMPGIKAVYDRYRSRGFEVVGLFLTDDVAKEKDKAAKVLAKTGGNAWTNLLVTGAEYKEILRRFAITGVPVTWLLDQDGRLITDDIHDGKLEVELQRLLDAEA